jgi:electron transport complex protein RnfG
MTLRASSERRPGWCPTALRCALGGLVAALLLPAAGRPAPPPAASAAPAAPAVQVFLTVDEALTLAFPGAEVTKETVYLTAEQRQRVEARLGAQLDSAVARPYVARRAPTDGAPPELVGVAWFESHRVRTLQETIMFAVDPQGRVQRVEVLAFAEPAEYLPRAKWYGQFPGRVLDDELQLGRGIREVAGATLTARATVAAARRSLALQAELFPPAKEPPPEPPPEPRPSPSGTTSGPRVQGP